LIYIQIIFLMLPALILLSSGAVKPGGRRT
jgi:hypothetical protein